MHITPDILDWRIIKNIATAGDIAFTNGDHITVLSEDYLKKIARAKLEEVGGFLQDWEEEDEAALNVGALGLIALILDSQDS